MIRSLAVEWQLKTMIAYLDQYLPPDKVENLRT